MTLVPLESVASALRCPRCGCGLAPDAEGFRCSSTACALHGPRALPVVGGLPVLIDAERSIVRFEDLSSAADGASAPLTGLRRWSIDRAPPALRSWWKPVNRVAAANMETIRSLVRKPSPLVLVVGGGTIGNGVEGLYADETVRIVAFDVYPSPLIQFIADAHQIPMAAESVDAVVVQAVLEHVLDPSRVVSEIHRVLRPHGLVYAETPFLQQVHAGPYDFTRYTSSGHRYLFRDFEEVKAGPVAGPGTQLLWSVDHIVRALTRSELLGKLTRAACFWLRLLDRLVPADAAMDNAVAYYFLGRRSNRRLTPREIVEYYQGRQQPSRRSSGEGQVSASAALQAGSHASNE
jgi:SAM-dependent methyltransferase